LYLAQADTAWPDVVEGKIRCYDVQIVETAAIPVTQALALRQGSVQGNLTEHVELVAGDDGLFALVDGDLKNLDSRPTASLRFEWPYLYRSIAGADPSLLDLFVYDAFGVVSFTRGEGTPAKVPDQPIQRMHDKSRDTALVPSALLNGLLNGFDTNPTRVREEAYAARFRALDVEPQTLWPLPGALSAHAMAVQISAALPDRMRAGTEVVVRYSLRNVGSAWLVPSRPHAVSASYRWYDAKGNQVGRDTTALRTPLPRSLGPKDTTSTVLRVRAPQRAGDFVLMITLVQELVGWFSDASSSNSCSGDVAISVA
jgi:hypothetical protein